MVKIGIFSGSFNPIHNGHLIMANYIVENTDIDRLIISVTPQNPLKDTILDSTFEQRCEMVTLALKDCNNNITMSSIEKNLPNPYYTVNTLNYFKSLYLMDEICLILGKDNLIHFKEWYKYQEILDNFKLYICNRPCKKKISSFVPYTVNNPLVDISSTFIRKEIKEGRNIDFYVPKEVNNFIKEHNLYKKT